VDIFGEKEKAQVPNGAAPWFFFSTYRIAFWRGATGHVLRSIWVVFAMRYVIFIQFCS